MSVATNTIHVDQSYGSGGDGSYDQPFDTMQAGVDALAGTRDGTVIIRNTVNATTVYGESVIIPGSTYLWIVGHGWPIIRGQSGAPALWTPTTSAVRLRGLRFEHIGSSQNLCTINGALYPSHAIDCEFSGGLHQWSCASAYTRVIRCKFYGGDRGVYLTGASPDAYIERCVFRSQDVAIQTDASANHAMVQSSIIELAATAAFRNWATESVMNNCAFRNNAAILAGNAGAVTLYNCTENNDLGGLGSPSEPVIRDSIVDDSQRFSAADIGVTRTELEAQEGTLDLVKELHR